MPEKAGKSGRQGGDPRIRRTQMRTGPAPVISGAREPICRSHRKKENGKMVPHPRRAEAIIRFSYRKRIVLCIIISPVLVLCFIHPQETEHDLRRGTRGEAGRAGESYSESSSHSRRISDPEKVNHDWGSLRAQRDLPSEWLRRRQAAKKMLPQRAGEGVSPVQASLAGNTSEPRPEQEEKVGKPYTLR